MPGSAACNNEQMVVGNSVTPRTASGKVAAVDGPLKIVVQSGDGTFKQDASKPLEFDVISGDALADTVYLISADADLGAGVKTITDTFTLTVTSAQAANFGFNVGTVADKAAVA